MTRMDDLGEEFTINFVNDFCNVERRAFRGMTFILFLSSAVRWPAKAGSACVILDMIRPMNSNRAVTGCNA